MQTLTELRLTLASLQDEIGNLSNRIDTCVEFLDTLTGGVPIPLPKRGRPRTTSTRSNKRTNGSGKMISLEHFGRQVRQHYTTHRAKRTPAPMQNEGQALEAARRKYRNVSDPSPDNVTTHEAAVMLGLSDSGTRLLYGTKLPRPTKELRKWGQSGRFHPAMVIPRRAVEAYLAGETVPNAPPEKAYKDTVRARRERTARLLKKFDRVKPRGIPKEFGPHGISVLVQHGYLEGKGDGYVRTNKEFRADLSVSSKPAKVAKPAKANGAPKQVRKSYKKSYGPSIKARRQRTAQFLDLFDRQEARNATALSKQAGMAPTALGSLVRRGYLAKKNGGYVRSGAEFTV